MINLKNYKLKKIDIILPILIFIYFLGLFRIYLISSTTFKIISIIICTFFSIAFFDKNAFKKASSYLLLVFFIVLSTVYNNNYHNGILNSLFYLSQFLSLLIVINGLSSKYGLNSCIRFFYIASALLTLFMDFSVLLRFDLDKTHYQNLITYLFGNKFMVSYLHMQTLGLLALKDYNVKKTNHKFKYLIYGLLSILICKYVDCSTGLVGNAIIMLLLIFPINKKLKSILSSPKLIIIFFLCLNILLVSGQLLIDNKIIQFIIEKVLNENITLTGRIGIYKMVGNVILQNPLIGHGYNSDIITVILGYGNAQNGILQFLLDCGILGTICFIYYLISVLKRVKYSDNLWPLYCMLISFLTCSLVEVCLKFNFFIIMIFFMVIEKKKLINKKEEC